MKVRYSEYTYFCVTTKQGGSIEDVKVRTYHALCPDKSPYGPTLREVVGNSAFHMLINPDRGDNTAKMLRGLISQYGYAKVKYTFIYSIEFEEAAEGGGFVT